PLIELSTASAPSTLTMLERTSPTDVQPAVWRGADSGRNVASSLRIGECKVDVIAAVDGQVVDAALRDGIGDLGLGCLDQRSFRRNGHRLLHAFEVQAQIGCCCLADGEDNRSILINREVGAAIDGHSVLARRKSDEVVASAVIRDGGTLRAGTS